MRKMEMGVEIAARKYLGKREGHKAISFASERVERHNLNLNLKILRRQIYAQVDQRLREQHELNNRHEDTCRQDEQ